MSCVVVLCQVVIDKVLQQSVEPWPETTNEQATYFILWLK